MRNYWHRIHKYDPGTLHVLFHAAYSEPPRDLCTCMAGNPEKFAAVQERRLL
jgi:hypothetical protein